MGLNVKILNTKTVLASFTQVKKHAVAIITIVYPSTPLPVF